MIESILRKKIEHLIEQAEQLTRVSSSDQRWVASVNTWLAQTDNAVTLTLPDFFTPYRRHMTNALGYGTFSQRLTNGASILKAILQDIDAGLLVAFGNKVRAESFESFLDHAVEYMKNQKKNEAGVIAGVVFEDTVRKIHSDKIGINKGKKLEDVINELKKNDFISEQRSKQAKVAAHVRTKATHAQWDEFDLDGVNATIEVTKMFLHEYMVG